MPLKERIDIGPQGVLGLWDIREPEEWFAEQLRLSIWEQEHLERIKGRKRTEFLAARMLVHALTASPERLPLEKDAFGKPFLPETALSVSLSHSHGYAAALLAPGWIGVDIQYLVEKIGRLAHKFLRPEELESLGVATRLEHLHVYWCAKEALYKAYGKKALDFCAHIHITPFAYQGPDGVILGKVEKDGWRREFELSYRLQEAHMLVWTTPVPG